MPTVDLQSRTVFPQPRRSKASENKALLPFPLAEQISSVFLVCLAVPDLVNAPLISTS